jgi:hypothetical protein
LTARWPLLCDRALLGVLRDKVDVLRRAKEEEDEARRAKIAHAASGGSEDSVHHSTDEDGDEEEEGAEEGAAKTARPPLSPLVMLQMVSWAFVELDMADEALEVLTVRAFLEVSEAITLRLQYVLGPHRRALGVVHRSSLRRRGYGRPRPCTIRS